MLCTYCGRPIHGKPAVTGQEGPLAYWDGDQETTLFPERDVNFCSHACAWQYGIKEHKLFGMRGKDIRRHLVQDHGLTPPTS